MPRREPLDIHVKVHMTEKVSPDWIRLWDWLLEPEPDEIAKPTSDKGSKPNADGL
jgi:hypothetical protein